MVHEVAEERAYEDVVRTYAKRFETRAAAVEAARRATVAAAMAARAGKETKRDPTR